MTMQDILTLAKAGYTAAQISALAAAEQPEQKQPEQKQPEQKQPEQKQPEQKQPEQKPEQPDIIAELREIKSAILAGAYMGAQQPATQDAESALAAIINPPDVLEMLGKSKKTGGKT